ncbi:MAG: hypothetical protein KKA84_13200 [Bacteroidetes bacterium]|nr:hypothetical protein [Bacteroidota bacterium]
MKIKNLYILLIFPLVTQSLQAQSFGFGCLGLSGIYGGYSIQQFDAAPIEDAIGLYNISRNNMNDGLKFDQLEGYRIGGNIFRARFSSLFITTKGYYQFLEQKQNGFSSEVASIKKDEYKLSLNHWGLGIDIGFPLFSFLDWKILEGGVNFYDVDFDYESLLEAEGDLKVHYSTDEVTVGYYAGTGLILHIIPDYISVEGTAFYNFVGLSNFITSDTDRLNLINTGEKLVEGRFGAVVQINVGFPL